MTDGPSVAHRVLRRLRESFATVRRDGLFRDGSVLVTAAIVGGGVNYVYQIAMGRLLGPADYGVFGSLFALSYLLLVLSAGVGYCATKFVSELDGPERVGFLRGFGLRIGTLTGLLFAGLVLASPAVASFLNIGDPALVVVMGLILLFRPLTAVQTGALRGLEAFVVMGGLNIGTAVAKFLVGAGLVLLGFGVYGAIGAPAVAAVLAVTVATVYLRRWYLGRGDFEGFGDVYRYAVPSLLVAFCFTVPTNADVVLVKHLFSAHTAGLYTSVSVFGKALIFLPAGISSALFPKVAKRDSAGRGTAGLLRRALVYAGGLAVAGAAVLMVVPGAFLGVLYGGAYVSAAPVLRWYAPAIAAFSLCVVMLNYSLAVDDLRFVKVFTAMTVVEVGLLYAVGATVFHLVGVLLVVNVVGAVAGWRILRRPVRAETGGAQPHATWVTDDD